MSPVLKLRCHFSFTRLKAQTNEDIDRGIAKV
jgi:hypothetical protein